jgi:hypothetical protein
MKAKTYDEMTPDERLADEAARRSSDDVSQWPKSWRVEVIADDSGKWCGNGLVFDTAEEAGAYGLDLASRWTLVRDWRVVEVSR